MISEARDCANRLGLVPPFFDQTQYNMIVRERIEVEYKPLYPDLGLTIWSPLGGGVLTGKSTQNFQSPLLCARILSLAVVRAWVPNCSVKVGSLPWRLLSRQVR